MFTKIPSSIIPHVAIEYDPQTSPNFPKQTDEALRKLNQGPSGNKLFSELIPFHQKGRTVTIRCSTATNASPVLTKAQEVTYGIPSGRVIANNRKAMELSHKISPGKKGEGASVVVNWNPNIALNIDNSGYPSLVNGGKPHPDAFLALGHELIHARRIVKGNSLLGDGKSRHDEKTEQGKEELRAVGIGPYSNRNLSENSFRREHNRPLRKSYKPKAD